MTYRFLILLSLTTALAGCGNPVTTPRAAAATQAAAGTPVPTATPAPVAYACSDASGGGTGRANVVAVRAAAGDGYDRWVLEFDGPVPGYQITRQDTATFTEDASGRSVTLEGAAGVVLRLQPAASGMQSPSSMSPQGSELRDLRRVGDFEGVVHWAAGLARPACMHVTTLDSPPRLVIDFKSS